MHLRSLELFGFKSFPDKTALKFDPGITVIVGPNGCGKSNVFDAIKWALGEQSPKSLRGAKMEDIIFNGTDTHEPLNYSEVTLTFSNEDNYLPIDYKEVAITRRLYRSGESQYFLNKNLARLKDIEDLFSGTGVGESTYSFIEQGKVETLLSYKPEEKRLIFDEASGIVKYKEKKKETMRKLESTEENIARLDDIISEVRRQTRYLERQVEKAKKYKEISQTLIEVEKSIAALRIASLVQQENQLLDEINARRQEEKEKEDAVVSKQKDQEANATYLNEVREKIEGVNSRIVSLNSHIDSLTNHIEIDVQRIEEFKNRLLGLDRSLQDGRQRIVLHQTRIEEEKKVLLTFDADIAGLEEKLAGVQEGRRAKIAGIEEEKKRSEAAKTEILHGEEEKVNLNNTLIETGAHYKNILLRKKRLTLDKIRIDEYSTKHRETYAALTADLASAEAEYNTLKGEKASISSQLRSIGETLETLERNHIEKEKSLVELKSYLEFLQNLKIKYEEFPVSKKVSIIFKEKPPKINKLIASLRDSEFSEVPGADGIAYVTEVEAKIISLPEEELIKRIENINSELTGINEAINQQKSQKVSLTEESNRKEGIISDAEKVLRQKMQEKENLDEALKRLEEERVLLERELEECLQEITRLEQEQQTCQEKATQAEQRLVAAKDALEQSQKTVTAYTEDINKLEIEIAMTETEAKTLAERKQSVSSKVSILEEEMQNLAGTIESFEREKTGINASICSLEEEIKSLYAQIERDKEEINEAQLSRIDLDSRRTELERRGGSLLEALRQEEKMLEEVRSSMYARKLEIQKLDFEKTKVIDYLKQVYSIDFSPSETVTTDGDETSLVEERDRLKKRIESLGEVNLVAIEEFEELNARYNFLNTQKQDLLTSKESLRKAIQKINRTSREVFIEVFQKIEEEFKKHFRFLFGGGRAQLILLDRENILESGVEIEVQPPGKKLQSVSLLSGGEKALTAIALIFSIFKVRPSPLCVLDEIDAPLDEANVDRFNQLLKEFSPTSQFIMITHNKKTMSRADVLYGVTMQEKGISKLVSVKFAEEAVH